MKNWILRFFISFALLLVLNACSFFTPHKMDIAQGQKINPESLLKLRLGMTEEQVEFLLGSASIKGLNEPNRWDYIESLLHDGETTPNRQLSLWFNQGELNAVNAQGYDVSHLQGSNAQRVKSRPVYVMAEQNKPQISSTPNERAIKDALNTWQHAWMNKDIRAYFSSYTPSYAPVEDISHGQWVSSRTQRIMNSHAIKIELTDINIQILNDNEASVQFVQIYKSNQYKDMTLKKLQLVNTDDIWLISQEQTLASDQE